MELAIFYRGAGVEKLTFPIPEGVQQTTAAPDQTTSFTESSSNYVQKITERVYRTNDGSWHYRREATVLYPRKHAGDDYDVVVNPTTGKVEKARSVNMGTMAPKIELADQVIIDPDRARRVESIYCDGYELFHAEEKSNRKSLQ